MDCIRTSYQARSGSQRKEGLNILPSFLLSLLFAIPAVPHQIPNLINVAEAQEPAPVAVVSLTTREEIEAYIVKRAIETGIPVDRALHVAKAESHLEPSATGDLSLICKRTGEAVYARGIYQLTRCFYPQVSDEDAFDAKKNIDYVFDNGLLKEGTCQSQFSTCK